MTRRTPFAMPADLIVGESLTDYHARKAALPRCGTSKAPPGWRCTRELGHSGPCAAVHASMDPDSQVGLLEAAKAVLHAYEYRFGTSGRFSGPIDEDMERLQAAVKGLG